MRELNCPISLRNLQRSFYGSETHEQTSAHTHTRLEANLYIEESLQIH